MVVYPLTVSTRGAPSPEEGVVVAPIVIVVVEVGCA